MGIKVRILKESKRKPADKEQLEEGFKETLLATLMMMAGMGNAARAMDIDVGSNQTITVQQLVPKLKADSSPEAVGIAQKVTDALKGGKDYDNSGSLDLAELGLDYDETELIKKLATEPDDAPATPEAPDAADEPQKQKDLFQRLKNTFGFGDKKEEPPRKPKKKKEKTMQQKIRDANKKSNAFDKLGKSL